MKKVIQILSAVILLGAFLTADVVTAAQTNNNCPSTTIENTGTDSDNSITCTTTSDTHVTCINNVYVVGENGQAATSGNAENDGNTSGGSAVTGSATNDNDQKVQVGASCGTTTTTTTTPPVVTPPATTTPTTTTPVATTTTPDGTTAATLPDTGSNTIVNDAIIGTVVLGGALAVSQVGVSAYRRLALK